MRQLFVDRDLVGRWCEEERKARRCKDVNDEDDELSKWSAHDVFERHSTFTSSGKKKTREGDKSPSWRALIESMWEVKLFNGFFISSRFELLLQIDCQSSARSSSAATTFDWWWNWNFCGVVVHMSYCGCLRMGWNWLLTLQKLKGKKEKSWHENPISRTLCCKESISSIHLTVDSLGKVGAWNVERMHKKRDEVYVISEYSSPLFSGEMCTSEFK